MGKDHSICKPDPIVEVLHQLSVATQLRRDEIDKVIYEVRRDNPTAVGQKFADLLRDAALAHYISGMGCC
ncbi:MAG TPA: hypothetical protein VH643_28255 [Gemmataceae bacterium]|jgi:hypothetical protein